MILQWVFTAFLNVIITIQFIDNYNTKYLAGAATALSALALSAPIALVADLYLGRYKVIQYSMRLLWIAVIASNTIIALQYYAVKNAATSTILIVFTTGIIVNSLQFGIDQLTDASSSDITSYISWYTWNYRVIESSSLVPVLFGEVFSHPYISFFHLLVNGFSVIYIYIQDIKLVHAKPGN